MHIIYTGLNLFLLWSNAYSSYKALQLPKGGPRGGQSSRLSQNRKREMKNCLAIWVVWVSWRSCERLGDPTVGIVMPFYHEVKCVILIILLLTRTWGAEPIVLHVIRPTIKPYIPLIDMILHWAHEAGDFVALVACLPYSIAHDWWYGSKSAPPYEEHHRDTRILVKPDPLLPPEKEPEPPKPQPSPTDAKPPAYTYPVEPSTVDFPPVPSKAQMINVVQQAHEVYREINNAQQQVREQASTIGTRTRKRSQANTTSHVPQAGPSVPNIVQFNPTKATVNTNMRPKAQAAQMQAPAIIKRHTGDLPLSLPLSNPQPQSRMSDLITVRGQDSRPISNTHALRNISVAPQQPRTEDSAMPFPQPQPAPPPSLYPTIPIFETPRLPGHLALSPLPAQPPPLPILERVPPIPPPRPPGLLPLNLPMQMPEPRPFQPATQSQTRSQAFQPPPILPKPAPPAPAPVLHQPQAQRMTHFPNTHPAPARPSAPPPVAIRRGSSNSTQGVAPPATRRGSTASQMSRRSTQDAVKEKEKLIATAATAATMPSTEEGFGPALPRPRGRSAAVAVSNTRKPDSLPVVLPATPAQAAVAGADGDQYGGRRTAPGSTGNRRGSLGARRGGRGLKTIAHGEREVKMDMLDRPISGADTDRAGPTRSRSKSKLDTKGSLEVGEGEVKQVQGVEARVKRLRSPIRAFGQIGREKTKGFVEGKDGKAPEKPELVAGKKRRFQQTKTKGRSTFSAITSSEEEGTENENEGSTKKRQRVARVVNAGDGEGEDEDEDEDEDETEDELTTPKRLFKVLSSPPGDKRSSILLGTKHDPDVEATVLPRPLSFKPIKAAESPDTALPRITRITRNRKGGN